MSLNSRAVALLNELYRKTLQRMRGLEWVAQQVGAMLSGGATGSGVSHRLAVSSASSVEMLESRQLLSGYSYSLDGAPTATAGAAYTLTLATDNPAVTSWSVDWGDGSSSAPDVELVPGNSPSATHAFTYSSQPRRITATASDGLHTYHTQGALNPSFGSGGVAFDLSSQPITPTAIAALPNGLVVVGGYQSNDDGSQAVALAEYNPDGTLQTAFGDHGRVVTQIGNSSAVAGIAVLANGNIVVTGYGTAADGDWGVALAEYNPDGSLSTDFGSGGVLVTEIGSYSYASSLAVLPSGSIVVTGYGTAADGNLGVILAEYLPDGTLNSSFGASGMVVTEIGSYSYASCLAVLSDGAIVVAGGTAADGAFAAALAKYAPDGSLDASFGIGGMVITEIGGDSAINAITVLDDGRILTAGYGTAADGSQAVSLMEYNANGTLNDAFGNNGTVVTPIGDSSSASAMSVLPGGRIVLAGYGMTPGGSYGVALAQYGADGSLDPAFGSGGIVVHAIGGYSYATAMAALPDGGIVLGTTDDTLACPPGVVALQTDLPVTITPAPPVVMISGESTASEGASYTLSLSAQYPAADTGYAGVVRSWTINWGDGTAENPDIQTITGNPESVMHVFADANRQYIISATVAADTGTYSAQGTVCVFVNDVAPSVTITPDPANVYQEGSSLHFTANVTDPGVNDTFTYAWSVKKDGVAYTLPGGTVTNAAEFSFTPDDRGVYLAHLTVTDNDGAGTPAESLPLQVHLAAPSNTKVTGVSSREVVVSWTDNSNRETGYLVQRWENGNWNLVGGTDPGVTSLDVSGLTPSTYYYFRVVTDDGVTSADDSDAFAFLLDQTRASKPTVDIVNTDDTEACVGQPANFSADILDEGNGGPVDLAWRVLDSSGNELASGSGEDFDYTPSAAGTYTIELTATDNLDGVATTTSSLEVQPLELTLSGPDQVDEGEEFQLSVFADATLPSGTSWVVDWGDDSPCDTADSGTSTLTHTYKDGPAFFTIDARLVDGDGNMIGEGALDVDVPNVAPDASISGDPKAVDGQSYVLTLSADDSGKDPVTWLIDWGDGSDPDDDGTVGQTLVVQSADGTDQQVTHDYADSLTHVTISAVATDKDGDSTKANQMRIAIVPQAPTGLTAIAISSSEVDLNWDRSSAGVVGYQIARASDGVHFSPFAQVSADTTGFRASGLTCGTDYRFRVEALVVRTDGDVSYSDPSETASAATSVPAPSGIMGHQDDTQSWTITWNRIAGPVDYYEIWCTSGDGWQYYASTGSNTTEASITTGSLQPGGTYSFCVRTRVGNVLSGPSAAVQIGSPQIPGAPVVTATYTDGGYLAVNWKPADFRATSYEIEVSATCDFTGSRSTTISGYATQTLVYLDPGLPSFGDPGQLVRYVRVRAINDGGESAYSAAAECNMQFAYPTMQYGSRGGDDILATLFPEYVYRNSFSPEENLEIREGGGGYDVRVFWDVPWADPSSCYVVRTGDGTTRTLTTEWDCDIEADTAYRYTLVTPRGSIYRDIVTSFGPVADLTAEPITDDLRGGTRLHWTATSQASYYTIAVYMGVYRVQLLKVDGDAASCDIHGVWGGPASFYVTTWNDCGVESLYPAVVTATPASPQSVQVNVVRGSATVLAVDWSAFDAPDDLQGYNLYATGMWNGAHYTKAILDISGGQQSYEFDDVDPYSSYYFSVDALYSDGSNTIACGGIACFAPPANVAAHPASSTSIKLTWQGSQWDDSSLGCKEGYEIEASTDGTNFKQIGTVSGDDTEFLATDLAPDTEYVFRIRAYSTGTAAPDEDTRLAGGFWSDLVRARPLPMASDAIRVAPGLFATQIPWDQWGSPESTEPIPLGFAINFEGQSFSQVYVSQNGCISFDVPPGGWDPGDLDFAHLQIIAPFLSNVLRQAPASGDVMYGSDVVDGHQAFAATWWDVSYFYCENGYPLVSPTNQFQVVLIDRSDIAPGDFDIELNYGHVRWQTWYHADLDQGIGDGSVPVLLARAGWSNGTGNHGAWFEFPGSGTSGGLLDDNAETGLAVTSTNSDVTGRHVFAIRSDLMIDSDNNNGLGTPSGSTAEDAIEDDAAKSGKIIAVDSGDSDGDGIPNFADGYDYDKTIDADNKPTDDSAGDLHFVPLVLKANGDPSKLTFQISYDASDPSAVTTTGTGTASDPVVYHLPANGKLRLWTRDGSSKRGSQSFDSVTEFAPDTGYYVAPGTYDTGMWASLAQACGQWPDATQLTLYVEAVTPSTALGDAEIVVSVDPDGSGSMPSAEDRVRLTAYGTQVVEVAQDGKLTPTDGAVISRPAPFFQDVVVGVADAQFNADRTAVVAHIYLNGTLSDHWSDMVQGSAGTIGSVDVYVNGVSIEAQRITTTVIKSPMPTIYAPYKFLATFSTTIEVTLSVGPNLVTLSATNGAGVSGTADIPINAPVTAAADEQVQVRLTPSLDIKNPNNNCVWASFAGANNVWSTSVALKAQTDSSGNTILVSDDQQITVDVGDFSNWKLSQSSCVFVTNLQRGWLDAAVTVTKTAAGSGIYQGSELLKADERVDFYGCTLGNLEVSPVELSGAGEWRPFVLQFVGPEDLAKAVKSVQLGGNTLSLIKYNGQYYFSDPNGAIPTAFTLAITRQSDAVVPSVSSTKTGDSFLDFGKGFAVGLYDTGVSLISGVTTLISKIDDYTLPRMIYRFATTGNTLTEEDQRTQQIFKAIAPKVAEFFWQSAQNNWDAIKALITGDGAAMKGVSERERETLSLAYQLLSPILEELKKHATSYDIGWLTGRVCGEILTTVGTAGIVKAVQAGKLVTLVGKLKSMAVIQKVPGLAEKLEASAVVITKMVELAKGDKVWQELMQLEEEARKTLPVGASTKEVVQKVLEATAGTKKMAGASLSNYVRGAAKGMYAEAVASGDLSKVMTYEEWYALLGGRLEKSWLEIHHASVMDITKQILKQNPKYAGWTDEAFKDLFKSMPSYPLDVIEHREGAPGVFKSFHDILKANRTGMTSTTREAYLELLQDTYKDWGGADGQNIFVVVKKWIENREAQP